MKRQPGVDNAMAVITSHDGKVKRKYLPYLMVNMIGIKEATASLRAA